MNDIFEFRMRTEALERCVKFSRYLLLSGSIVYFLVYIILVIFRIRYPFELEWMEGGSLDHVHRILSGQKLYVAPSIKFIPFIYTPLYYYLSAALAKVIGDGFFPLRLLSFISSLGSFLVIYLFVKRETGSSYFGILASALLPATFFIGGAWFDIARTDSLFLFLFLTSLYCIKFKDSAVSHVLAGVLISLAFLTKQIALFISLPVMVFCIFANRRRGVLFIGTVALVIGAGSLLLNRYFHGWYNYYVFHLPSHHDLNNFVFFSFWAKDILMPLPISFLTAALYVYIRFSGSNSRDGLFYLMTGIGMIGGAWASRLHTGGYANVLIPAYACISILFGLAAHELSESIRNSSLGRRKVLELCFYILCIVQFASLAYNPIDQIPTTADLKAGIDFVNKVARIQGDVFIPHHPYLSARTGKGNHLHIMALHDVISGDESPVMTELDSGVRQMLKEKRFGAIILDSDSWDFDEEAKESYTKQHLTYEDEDTFFPVTGLKIRPRYIYLPKGDGTD